MVSVVPGVGCLVGGGHSEVVEVGVLGASKLGTHHWDGQVASHVGVETGPVDIWLGQVWRIDGWRSHLSHQKVL